MYQKHIHTADRPIPHEYHFSLFEIRSDNFVLISRKKQQHTNLPFKHVFQKAQMLRGLKKRTRSDDKLFHAIFASLYINVRE